MAGIDLQSLANKNCFVNTLMSQLRRQSLMASTI